MKDSATQPERMGRSIAKRCGRPRLNESQALTPKQEQFARLVALEGLPLLDAYSTVYSKLSTTRATARAAGWKAAQLPHVARRIRELRDGATATAMRPVQALIAELAETVDADPGELLRVQVGCCSKCWPGDFEHGREPNPECSACGGAGDARVAYRDTAEASPAARRLVRGVETWPDGRVKRLFLHDQAALRVELHRLRGLHVERSVNLNVTAQVPRLADMSSDQMLDLLESIRPTTSAALVRESVTLEHAP